MEAILCNKPISRFTNDTSIATKKEKKWRPVRIKLLPLHQFKDSWDIMMMMMIMVIPIHNFSANTDVLFVTLSSETAFFLSCKHTLKFCSTEQSLFQTISRQRWQNKHHCHLSFAGKFRPCNNNKPTHYIASYCCCPV